MHLIIPAFSVKAESCKTLCCQGAKYSILRMDAWAPAHLTPAEPSGTSQKWIQTSLFFLCVFKNANLLVLRKVHTSSRRVLGLPLSNRREKVRLSSSAPSARISLTQLQESFSMTPCYPALPAELSNHLWDLHFIKSPPKAPEHPSTEFKLSVSPRARLCWQSRGTDKSLADLICLLLFRSHA